MIRTLFHPASKMSDAFVRLTFLLTRPCSTFTALLPHFCSIFIVHYPYFYSNFAVFFCVLTLFEKTLDPSPPDLPLKRTFSKGIIPKIIDSGRQYWQYIGQHHRYSTYCSIFTVLSQHFCSTIFILNFRFSRLSSPLNTKHPAPYERRLL